MSMRMAPPGWGTTSHTGLVKCCGPHHWARCWGSVHALITSSRGASMMRVRTSSHGAVPGCCAAGVLVLLFVVVMVRLLCLQFAEVVLQAVQARVPEPAVLRHPHVHVLKGGGGQVVPFFPPHFAGRNQPGGLQEVEVFHDPKAGQ